MKAYKRADRVKHLIQQEIGQILQFETKDPRIQAVSVTDVKLTADLREATILVSTFDATVDRKELLHGLGRAAGYIRGELARRLTLRFVPQIQFVFDDSLDKQERIFELLDQVQNDLHPAPAQEE